MFEAGDARDEVTEDPGFWRRLLHRWFVEYNPFYFVSAACVLVGTSLISNALPRAGSVYGQLGVAAIAEAYAWALIMAAAWLMRSGSRRPAVMLALLVVLYQGDPTLHTETSACLGVVGTLAGGAWLVSFVGKLLALARALRLRLSTSAIAVPTLGAFGLVVLPRYLDRLDPTVMTVLLSLWVFAVFACGLWSSRAVESTVPLDAWGRTVLRRALGGTWLFWSGLWMAHVLFWIDDFDLNLGALVPVACLLATRWMRSQAGSFATVCVTLMFAGTAMPRLFWIMALLGAVVLALRALRRPTYVELGGAPGAANVPYRTFGQEPPRQGPPVYEVAFVPDHGRAIMRLVTGSATCVYLSAWTFGWSGGSWPEHVLALDLIFAAALALLVWKTRSRFGYGPLAATYLHLGVQTGLIAPPVGKLEWGISFVAAGFSLLIASLFVTWRLKKTSA